MSSARVVSTMEPDTVVFISRQEWMPSKLLSIPAFFRLIYALVCVQSRETQGDLPSVSPSPCLFYFLFVRTPRNMTDQGLNDRSQRLVSFLHFPPPSRKAGEEGHHLCSIPLVCS